MGSESTGIEELDHFRSISKKLKKTFFKKPNETEALDSYTTLAREWENSGLHSYAGLCWTAAAKCENSLGNATGEVTDLVKSARQYASAEENNVRVGSVRFGFDNLQASLNSYSSAAAKYEKKSSLVVTLNLEVVEFLEKIGRGDLAEDYLKEALNHCSNGGDFMKVHCLNLLAKKFIEEADYLPALNTFTEIHNSVVKLPPNAAYADILLKCEISRVLLLLILKPPPQKLTPELAKILERYTWGDRNDDSLKNCKMSEYLFVLLESLVTTCQSADKSYIVDLEGQLWPFLDVNQKTLLHILVRIYYP
ncbi:hypothetical protein WA026_000476 [Henosepilachna vigintioctopunctata]|uniref:Factor VIII intron 22 protein n=1 Tax=Henosepilachna vigintioctopunctata TaxID=420089 RepID=A0AAW1V4A4_9CUCU